MDFKNPIKSPILQWGFFVMITFQEKNHKYHDKNGFEYMSVSKLIGTLDEEFQEDFMAGKVAMKRFRMANEACVESGVEMKEYLKTLPLYQRAVTKEGVLQEWEEKREEASNWGTLIHNQLEDHAKGKAPKYEFMKLCDEIKTFFEPYHKTICEEILYSEAHMLAGTSDRVAFRSSHKSTIVDYYDYKTNVIKYDSGKYRKFLKKPAIHLENCNYVKYCLQLSLYAYMGEITHGRQVGRLGIINIDRNLIWKIIPVPYMKSDVETILKKLLTKADITRRTKQVKEAIDWVPVKATF